MHALLLTCALAAAKTPTCPPGTTLREASTPEAREARCERSDGTRHGPRWAWYPSGEAWFQGEYAEDKRSGAWTFWFPSGALMAKGSYRDDKAEGTFERFHEGGKIAVRGVCVGGLEEGMWLRHWPNGKDEVSIVFRQGKATGPARYTSRRGVAIDEVTYLGEKNPGARADDDRHHRAREGLRPEALFQECRN